SLKDRATDLERFYIQGHYYDEVTGELAKTEETYQEWSKNYPRDTTPLDNLCLIYFLRGEFDKVIATARRALEIDSLDVFAYDRLAFAFIASNRLDEAKSIAEQALASHLDDSVLHLALFDLAFLQGNAAEMEKVLASQQGESEVVFLLMRKAWWQVTTGKLKSSLATYREAEGSAKRQGLADLIPVLEADQAEKRAYYGDCANSKELTHASLAASPSGFNSVRAALAMAQCGQGAEAAAVMAKLGKERPTATILHDLRIPAVNALAQIQQG